MMRRTFLCLSARAGGAGRRRENWRQSSKESILVENSKESILAPPSAGSWGALLGLSSQQQQDVGMGCVTVMLML